MCQYANGTMCQLAGAFNGLIMFIFSNWHIGILPNWHIIPSFQSVFKLLETNRNQYYRHKCQNNNLFHYKCDIHSLDHQLTHSLNVPTGGSTSDITCNTSGMLSMGKIIPESIMVGIIKINPKPTWQLPVSVLPKR